jgi:ubiquinone/menaquinone biosynthesis C-methylase UbiE
MTTQAPTTEQIRTAWDALAPGYDDHVTPHNVKLGEQALRRLQIGPGTRLLDVAAGSGALSLPAARRGADVLAVDTAPTMVERLVRRARAENLTNLTGRVMDGYALDLADDAFDVAASQHGVSIFPDMSRGLAELTRVTRPGGRVLIVAFGPIQQAEFIVYFIRAVQATVPGVTPPPMDPPPLPFQVSDPDVLRTRLERARLTGVAVETTTWDMEFASAAQLWDTATSSNPIAAQLVAGVTAEQRSEVQAVLDGMLRERSGGKPGAVLHAAVNIGTGTK